MKTLIIFVLIVTCPLSVWAGDFQISSTAFEANSNIPSIYTCNGQNINPPLVIKNVPMGTKSLALTVSDPDSPHGIWSHWIVYNIPPDTTEIPENTSPGTAGINDFGKNSYGGPCPPDGKPHHYIFHLYALDTVLNTNGPATLTGIEKSVQGHIVAEAELIGLYQKIDL